RLSAAKGIRAFLLDVDRGVRSLHGPLAADHASPHKRHPGAACAPQGASGKRPAPMHIFSVLLVPVSRRANSHRACAFRRSRSKLKGAWIPAWSRLFASLTSGAGMTLEGSGSLVRTPKIAPSIPQNRVISTGRRIGERRATVLRSLGNICLVRV